MTFVYVTHDQVEAMTMGTRVAVLRNGVLEQVDDAQTLYDRPANLFVASFIGSPQMNLIPADVRVEGGTIRVEAKGLGLVLDANGRRFDDPPASAILGIRPEHIDLAGAEPTPDRTVVRAEVSYVEPMGGEALMGFVVGEKELVAKVREPRGVRAGEHVSVAIETRRVYLYDRESERLALAPA